MKPYDIVWIETEYVRESSKLNIPVPCKLDCFCVVIEVGKVFTKIRLPLGKDWYVWNSCLHSATEGNIRMFNQNYMLNRAIKYRDLSAQAEAKRTEWLQSYMLGTRSIALG